ncbi:MAG: gamma-glutamyl-gamma-aminobutyrate hydrolase family protein [Balneolaceae bacterium]|nr:MAG: gamma-glutamyl-gamma-aminobutyrate hydrolase family protein [Balneolaceae bacterium]
MFSRLNKPAIGVTGPDRGGYPAWFFTRIAVRRAGGRAVRIRPGKRVDPEILDGLIIGGGADIDPGRYSETIDDIAEHQKKGTVDEKESGGIIAWLVAPVIMLIRKLFSLGSIPVDLERDKLEHKFLDIAVQKKWPVLGICRGAQFLNVFWGGNLHPNIIGFYTEEPKIESVYPRKKITITKGSHLEGILQKDTCLVNSLHNQAVDRPGPDILIAATDLAGVVQAVEHKSYPFALGVQWHPEYLPQVKSQQLIFRKLVRLAASQNENKQE